MEEDEQGETGREDEAGKVGKGKIVRLVSLTYSVNDLSSLC